MEHKTENLGNAPTTGGDVWAQARNNQRVSTLIRRANSPRLADLVGTKGTDEQRGGGEKHDPTEKDRQSATETEGRRL